MTRATTRRPGRAMVGRRHEWSTATGALDAAALGPAWLVVDGEPGIGKTHLLAVLADAAAARGFEVLAGRGAEFERDLPFGIWVDALDDHLARLAHDRRRTLPPGLGAVFPSLAGSAGAVDVPVHRAVRDLLTTPSPTLLVLDDLHWADPASLELLARLVRSPPPGPLLVAVGLRTGRVPAAPAAAALEAATRDGGGWVTLGPLARDEADRLPAVGRLPPVQRERVYRASGGNPFYLQQLAAAPSAHDDEPGAGRDADGVPTAVAVALDGELAALSADARLLGRAVAVAGEPCAPGAAAGIAGLPDGRAAAALDELLDAGLLRSGDEPDRYRFRHPIVRRTVHAGAGERWRRRAHARAAARLPATQATLALRAHHLDLSAAPGDGWAAAVLLDAAAQAAPAAPAAAAGWYAAALRVGGSTVDADRLALTVRLARLLLEVGDLRAARARLGEALALQPADDLRVELAAGYAATENMLGEHGAAHDRLHRTLTELSDARSVPAAALHVELATDALHDADHAETLYRARAAADVLAGHDRPDLAAAAHALAAYAAAWADPDGADDAVDRAAAAVDTLPDDQLVARLDAAHFLGHAELQRDRLDDAGRHLRRGIRLSRATGREQYLVPMLCGMGYVLDAQGVVAEGVRVTGQAVEVARRLGSPFLLSWSLAFHSWTSATAGDPAARTAAQEAVRTLDPDGPVVHRAVVHALCAPRWLDAGDPDRCLESMAAAGAPELRLVAPAQRCGLFATLAGAELARDDPTAARTWVDRARDEAARSGLSLAGAAALRCEAELLRHTGEAERAAVLAVAAADAAGSAGAPVEQARAWLLAGRSVLDTGDGERASPLLQRAETALAGCGARPAAQEAATLRRRSAAAGSWSDPLTPRERRIAELVAHGHTNRQLATTLSLSEKTIEASLTRIFGKVGVGSRAALAVRVATGG